MAFERKVVSVSIDTNSNDYNTNLQVKIDAALGTDFYIAYIEKKAAAQGKDAYTIWGEKDV